MSRGKGLRKLTGNTSAFPCGRMQGHFQTRRAFLRTAACGFGSVALWAMLGKPGIGSQSFGQGEFDDAAAGGGILGKLRHVDPRVKRVIFLYMDGGPSQVDTFDPKPLLDQEHGQPFKMQIEPTQFNNVGKTMGSPWKFTQHGDSGIPISSLFPHMAKHADKLCVIRSMTSNFSEHTTANYFLHTGTGFQGRPSMGAWIGYGLGSDCQELPGFVVLNGGLIPPGGLDCFNSGFLPATYQGSIFKPGEYPLANILPRESSPRAQREKLDLVAKLDRYNWPQTPENRAVESAIGNYELAFRMQAAVPALTDIGDESAATRELYGVDSAHKGQAVFARQCLIARRLMERGVRFVELTCPSVGHDRWDQHNDLRNGHQDNALAVDQPIGGLLTDLQQRGLLDDTLVVWSGEFGRTPFAQGDNGRDHNPFGFSLWMCGGGIKGGTVYGATDEYGYKAVEQRAEMHDLHATMLHLLGVDHEQLTFRWSGRDMRLTDVHGRVMHEVLA